MRFMLVVALWMCAVSPALAEERRYAIISLVGDKLLVVHQDVSTGPLDRNARQYFEMPNRALDDQMTIAIEDAVKAQDKSAVTLLLAARDASLYEVQSRALEGAEGGLESLLPSVIATARKAGATHLILATKRRAATRVRLAHGTVGTGTLDGLGFYLDDNKRMQSTKTGERTMGLIAPFVYVSLALVDLSTGKVVHEELIREARGTASQQALVPWDALTGEQKVRMLSAMMRIESRRVMPALLQ